MCPLHRLMSSPRTLDTLHLAVSPATQPTSMHAAPAAHQSPVESALRVAWCGAGREERCALPIPEGLEVNYRSRYVHLSWARFERDEGNVDNARELFRRGHTLNPQDAPLLQAWAVMEYKEGKMMWPGNCLRPAPGQTLIISTSGRCAVLESTISLAPSVNPWRRRRSICCRAMQAVVRLDLPGMSLTGGGTPAGLGAQL